MKYRSGLLFLFGLGCMGLLATPATASKMNLIGYFQCSTRVISYSEATGRLTLEASLIPFPDFPRICETLTFGVVNVDGLEVLSPLSWELPRGDSLAPIVTTLEVIVQPGDTAGFGLATRCGTWYVEWPQFFALLGDSVAVYPSDPRNWPPLDVPPSEEEATRLRLEHWERAHAEWEQRQRDLDTIPPDGFQYTGVLLVDLADSALYDSLSETGRRQLAEMRLREREPLLHDEREIRLIEGRAFQRFRGERVFQRARTSTTEEIVQQTRNRFDSLHAAWADQPRDIIVDLHEPADSVFVRSLVDTLIPTDSAGFYRTTILYKYLKELEVRQIQYRQAEESVGSARSPQGRSSAHPSSNDPGESTDSRDTLFFDGFEGSFPFTWNAADYNAQSGSDYWGGLYYLWQHSSPRVAWCAEQGDMPLFQRYDNNMYSCMEMKVPVGAAGYANRRLTFWADFYTDDPDFCQVYGSSDCENWVPVAGAFAGYSWGWYQFDHPLPTNDSLCLWFFFASDNTLNDHYGVVLDDVTITADPPPRPNLTYWWPPYWTGPLVPSNVPGTTEATDLFYGESTYVDWAIMNDAGGAAPAFHVGLYLGDVLLHEWSLSGLQAYATHHSLDYPVLVSDYGSENLRLVVDNRGEVVESDEWDNVHQQSFWWSTPELTYTGHVRFWNMTPPETSQMANGVLIQMLDGDGATLDTLAQAYTYSSGFFSLGPVPNNNDYDEPGGLQQDIMFRVVAANAACRVMANPTQIYEFYADGIWNSNHPSGTFSKDISISESSSGSFFIADVMREARSKWLQCRPALDPGVLRVNHWTNCGTKYDMTSNTIFIEPADDSLHHSPDTFDRDVILHEYGHLLADLFPFFIDLAGGAHSWCTRVTPEKAAAEAWAHFWSSFARNDSRAYDRWNSFSRDFWIDLETSQLSLDTGGVRTANTMGRTCEGAVAATLWDVYDTPNDNHSSRSDWGDTTLPHFPDGIGDTLASGIAPILTTLLDRTINGHHPNTLDEFWTCWFQDPSNGHAHAMRDIRWEHGDSLACCVGIRGNIDGDPNDIISTSDVTYLIAYIFRGGPPPPCPEEADVDADGIVSVADVTYFISYMDRGGPAPAACP